jgi:hypothetical protein
VSVYQFIRAGMEDRTQHGIQPVYRPLFGQGGRDCCIEPLAIGGRSADDIGKQCGISLAIPVAFYLVAKPVPGKLAHDRFRVALSVQLELVQRLNRQQTRDASTAARASRFSARGFIRLCPP